MKPLEPSPPRRSRWSVPLFRPAYYRNVGLLIKREYTARIRRRAFIISTGVAMAALFLAPFLFFIIARIVMQPSKANLSVPDDASSAAATAENDNPPVTIAVIEQDNGGYASKAITYLYKAFEAENEKATPDKKNRYQIFQGSTNEYDSLHKKLEADKLSALAVLEPGQQNDFSFKYYSAYNTSGSVDTVIRRSLEQLSLSERLTGLGIDPAKAEQVGALAETKYEIVSSPSQPLISDKSGLQNRPRPITYLIIALSAALFLSIFSFGVSIGQGAAEEKTSRIVEIIIAAVTPFQLMLSKIIGIWLAGITQYMLQGLALITGLLLQIPLLLIFPIKGVRTGLAAGANSTATTVPFANSSPLNSLPVAGGSNLSSVSAGLLGSNLSEFSHIVSSVLLFYPVAYILGFIMWASLYAAIGSLASRQEDINFALSPLNSLVLSNYLLIVFASQSLDSLWVAILSYIPLYTPMLMFARLASGNASWWEGIIGLVWLLISAIFFVWLSARVYRAGLLIYGRKPTLNYFFKLVWSKG